MTTLEYDRRLEKPFKGKRIYFSSPIRGVQHPNPSLSLGLISYLEENGAVVLSKHVGIRDRGERDSLFIKLSGIDRSGEIEDPAIKIRQVDLAWVDEATHLIAIVDTPSIGVGMEIQRALDKHRMGMKATPVLCLVGKEGWNELTNMVKGISENDSLIAIVRRYRDLEHAKKIIAVFLAFYNW